MFLIVVGWDSSIQTTLYRRPSRGTRSVAYVSAPFRLTLQRLSEKFWRTFVNLLHEAMSKTTDSEDFLPFLGTFEEALAASRLPRPAVVNGTVSSIDLHIGSPDVDPEQAILIPIRYSKATMKARPPTLSKAWKPAMDLQGHQRQGVSTNSASNLLANSVAEQSQALDVPAAQSDLAAMISADVKSYSAYVVKRADKTAPPSSGASQFNGTQAEGGPTQATESTLAGIDEGDPDEEEPVAKEDIVKAWRFGSTWVPMEQDTFDPLDTRKGVEILGFFPRSAVSCSLCQMRAADTRSNGIS